MNKTLMIAATLLTLGAGSAFADGNVPAQPAQVERAPIAQQANGHQTTLFSTQSHGVSVYSLFLDPVFTQGGEQ